MSIYYNENDPKAAAWLRELIKNDVIAPGEVDERSIEDVTPNDIKGFTQCHFFAGIGVWSHALRRAGWPDDKPVWTGSCPCQPFSSAGKRSGATDERHLWPAWEWLIGKCRPRVIFGEQVASKDALAWFDLVSTDLEGQGYSCSSVDLCAAGFGAPHIRQRLFWVADSSGERLEIGTEQSAWGKLQAPQRSGDVSRMEHSSGDGWVERRAEPSGRSVTRGRGVGRVGDTNSEGSRWISRAIPGTQAEIIVAHGDLAERIKSTSAASGFWRDAEWVYCSDGKYRPIESGTRPLAHGIAGRVGLLRGYGNAIVAPVAIEFIKAAQEILTQAKARE